MAAVEKCLPNLPDLSLFDLKMTWKSGIEILGELRAKEKDAVVIIMTAYGPVEAMKLGAYDFINKTVDIQLVELVVSRTLEYLALRRRARNAEKLRAY